MTPPLNDPLSPDERAVARALGAGPLPEPRLTDAAFAGRVMERRGTSGDGRRLPWLAGTFGAALAAAAVLFVVVGPSGPADPVGDRAADATRPASGAELYALTRAALDEEALDPELFGEGAFSDDLDDVDPALSAALYDDGDLDPGALEDSLDDVEQDGFAAVFALDWSDPGDLDDDELAALADALGEELPL